MTMKSAEAAAALQATSQQLQAQAVALAALEPIDAAMAAVVLALESSIRKGLDGGKITVGQLPTITIQAMTLVRRYPEFRGTTKKQIVLDVVKTLILQAPDSLVEDRDVLIAQVQTVIPGLIDLFIDVAKGRFDIVEPHGLWKLLAIFAA